MPTSLRVQVPVRTLRVGGVSREGPRFGSPTDESESTHLKQQVAVSHVTLLWLMPLPSAIPSRV